MDTVARWQVVDGVVWAHVDDLIAHLQVSSESVLAMCADSSPSGALQVSMTLDTTAESLRDLRRAALDAPVVATILATSCVTCGHAEAEHVLSVDRCNHRAGEDVRCTCDRFEVAP